MIIYFSGGGVKGVWRPVNERLIEYGGARLISFAYRKLLFDFCELARDLNLKCPLLVDSGAFTAWTKGEQVDLDYLASTFKEIQDKYSDIVDLHLINLDRIPGRKGVDPTPDEIKQSMAESVENFNYLNLLFPGKVLPVFHQGEPQNYLNDLKGMSDYVCLSPRNDVAEKQRVSWARQAHDKEHKYHGLATTGQNMMETVNWYSVDSAGWVMVGGMGSIFINVGDGLRPISISSTSPNLQNRGKHVETSPAKDFILDTIASKGFDYEDLQMTDTERYIWNMERLVDYQHDYSPRHSFDKGLFDL